MKLEIVKLLKPYKPIASIDGTLANSADRPRSDQDLHCLLTVCSIWWKMKKYHLTLLQLENGLVLLIMVGKSTRLKWVNKYWSITVIMG